MNTLIKRIKSRKLLSILAISWCCYWWGYAVSAQSARRAEMTSINTRIVLGKESVRETGQNNADAQTIIRMETTRLNLLQTISDSSMPYIVFAPFVAPYEAYILHSLSDTSHEH